MTVTDLVSLDQVYARLGLDEDNLSDEEVADIGVYLDSASGVIADLYGDVLPKTYTEIIQPYGDGTRILLSRSPVLSVQSVQISWYGSPSPAITLDPLRYRLDGPIGVIQAVGIGAASSFANVTAPFGGLGYNPQVTVTYVSGRTEVTPQVQDALLEMLRINYQPQRSGFTMGTGELDPNAGFTYLGYYVPNSVHERLTGGKRPRQVA